MKFKKITLTNFRQFKNTVELTFSTDPERNLTVIHAMNGAGKTTLLQAFRWCLYEEVNLPNKKQLLNGKAFVDLTEGEKETVTVAVEFEHQNRTYTAIRKQIIIKKNNTQKAVETTFKVQFTDHLGQAKFVEGYEATKKIETVLSKGLANYALFDGERIENLGANTKFAQAEMKNAIYMIFNITVYEAMLKRLSTKVRNNIQAKIVKTTESAAEFNVLQAEIDQFDIEYDQIKQELQKNEARLEEVKNQLQIMSRQIEKVNSVRAIEIQIQTNKKTIDTNHVTIDALLGKTKQPSTKAIRKNFTNYITAQLFVNQYAEIQPTLKKIGDQKVDINNLIPKELVTQLIEEDACICGTTMTPSIKQKLIDLEQLLPLLNIGSQLQIWQTKATSKNNQLVELQEQSQSDLNRLNELVQEIETLTDENRELNKQISTFAEVSDLSERRANCEIEHEELVLKVARNTVRIEEILKNRKEIQLKLNTLTKKHTTNSIEEQKLNLTDQIIQASNERMRDLKVRVHHDLQLRVNEIFSQVAHKGTKKIEINPETYDYIIYDEQTKLQSLSEGEKVITSLSFIAAIISVAKQVAKKGEESVNSEMPLVLDAPFAKLDSIHLNKIAPVLPGIADQVILFTVDQQFKTQAEEVLKDKIGVQYVLDNSGDNQVSFTTKL